MKVRILSANEIADSTGFPKFVWVQFSSNEEEPYYFSNGPFDFDDKVVSDEDLNILRTLGVCTEIAAHYPNGDKYTVPALAEEGHGVTAEGNAAFIADHFRVDVQRLSHNWVDRGDDGVEDYWLMIRLPENSPIGQTLSPEAI